MSLGLAVLEEKLFTWMPQSDAIMSTDFFSEKKPNTLKFYIIPKYCVKYCIMASILHEKVPVELIQSKAQTLVAFKVQEKFIVA